MSNDWWSDNFKVGSAASRMYPNLASPAEQKAMLERSKLEGKYRGMERRLSKAQDQAPRNWWQKSK